ncbi:reverse transcriptase domain-containing protein [Tanacetum coccineum]
MLVRNVDDTWRMCIEFKNVNSTCPKDYYPLPKIDLKIESTQLGRNLEAYMDDMVIKNNTEQEMLMDIVKTLDNLWKVKMKLNLNKCSFGVKEGKLLGYMVTLKGIRANPKKTKAVEDMQSPSTLKEMQSLSGILAALNRFLYRSVVRALPFFETLKNITKENKDDYRWTKEAECAFQEMKKRIIELLTLTILFRKRSYTFTLPHPKMQQVESFWPNTKGSRHQSVMSVRPYVCYTCHGDGVSSLKGVGVGLVLIDPTVVEYTYNIRLNFPSTNNEAKYEALLAGLRITRKIKVRAWKVKVDSKLVACHLNGEFVASIKGMTKYLTKAKEQVALFKNFQ